MKRLKGISMILGGAACWGATGPMIEWLLTKTGMEATFMLAVRLMIAGVLLLAILRATGTNIWSIWQQATWRNQLLLFSLVGMLGLQFTFVRAIEESNAIVATLLQFLAPIFIVLYVSIIYKKMPPKAQIVGMLGTLSGLFLLLTNGAFHSLQVSAVALLWGIGLGFTYAFYTLYPARLMAEWGVLVVVAWGILLSGLEVALLGRIWQSNDWQLLTDPTTLWIMLAVIVVGSAAYILFLNSLKYISAVETSVLSSFEPVTTTIISVIWLGSTMLLWQYVGMLLMLIFVAYLSIAGKEATI